MDALTLLKQDHQEVNRLFRKSAEVGRDERKQIVDEILKNLAAHAQLEEKYLYPELKKLDPETGLEAFEEHHVMKLVMSELKTLDADDERYPAKVKVLKELVEHHVEEEEGQAFPRLRRGLGEGTLNAIGARMAEERPRLIEQGPRVLVTMMQELADSLKRSE